MYYIIGDGRILEFLESCPDQDYIKAVADDCLLDELWVIKGEHSGITWTRPEDNPETIDKSRLVFGQSAPGNRLHHAPKHRPLSLRGENDEERTHALQYN